MGRSEPPYRRALLKISGEILAGDQKVGLDSTVLHRLAQEVREVVRDLGVQLGIVVGGGNVIRGATQSLAGVDRATADYMGMLATVINALALQSVLESYGLVTRVQSALEVTAVAEPYIRRRAVRHLEKGRVVIFAAGTGNPFFTTDTAAVLRAAEIGAQAVLKGTKVDGVYTGDPLRDPAARKLERITFSEIIGRDLKVIDGTAATLCRENGLPLIVFNLTVPGNLVRVLRGEPVGTLVTP